MAGIFDFGDEASSVPSMGGAQAVPLTTLGDVVSESYDDFMLSRRTNADKYYLEGGPFSEGEYDKRTDVFKELSGGGSLIGEALAAAGKVDDKTRFSKVPYRQLNDDWKKSVNDYITTLREQDPEKYKNIKTDDELLTQYTEAAKAQREKFEITVAGASPTVQTVGPIIGGIGASFFDPVNIATLPLGAASRSGMLLTMAAEAGINVAATAATIPEQIRLEKMIGREYTAKDALLELTTAGAFGAVFGGGSKFLSDVVDKRVNIQQKVIDDLLNGGDVEGGTALKSAQRDYLTNSYDLSGYFDSPLSRTLDTQVQSFLYGDAGFRPLKMSEDGTIVPRPDLADGGLQAIETAYRSERLSFQEAQIRSKQKDIAEAQAIYEFKRKSIESETYEPNPDLTVKQNAEAKAAFNESKPQRVNEAFKERDARVKYLEDQYNNKLESGVSKNLRKQDDEVNRYLKSKKSTTDNLIAQGQRNLKQEIDGINKARKVELQNVTDDLNKRLIQAEADSRSQDLSRKAKKQAQKNLPKVQAALEAEYAQIRNNVNEIYDEQIGTAKGRQAEIDAFNYQRSKAYQWDKDIKEVQAAIDDRRPINPANVTLDDKIIMGMNPDRVTNLVARRQLVEVQTLEKMPISERVAQLEQPMSRQDQVLSELVFNTGAPRDANIKVQADIARINESQKMKLEELDRAKAIDPNEKVFTDGEADAKGNYRAESQESVGKITQDYEDALALQGIIDSCGLNKSGGNE